MDLSQNQVRFLIAARSFLNKVKLAKPEINIYDYEVPKGEIVHISKLSDAEAEETAHAMNKSGLIHVQICDGKFDCCKVASLSFDLLDRFLANMAKNK